MTPNVHYVGHVYTADHNAFNCTPRAVLNISRDSMARYGFSPATRVFEAAGASACLITDAWEGIEQFLEPQREVLVAANGAEVGEILETLDMSRARRIGEAARRRVLAEHTYAHRANELCALLGMGAVA
jgi:spore maturation protein CgeB